MSPGRVIGVDLGSRRIGVAVSDSDRRIATGVTILARAEDRLSDHTALAAIVERYEAGAVVVGLPLSLSGRTGPAASAVLEEVDQIRRTLGVPVETFDERFSTVVASDARRMTGQPVGSDGQRGGRTRQRGGGAGRSARKRREPIDAAAAAVILQGWLDAAMLAGEAHA